jgi:hypothetical protein
MARLIVSTLDSRLSRSLYPTRCVALLALLCWTLDQFTDGQGRDRMPARVGVLLPVIW